MWLMIYRPERMSRSWIINWVISRTCKFSSSRIASVLFSAITSAGLFGEYFRWCVVIDWSCLQSFECVQAVIWFGVVLMFLSTIGGFRSLLVEASGFHFYKTWPLFFYLFHPPEHTLDSFSFAFWIFLNIFLLCDILALISMGPWAVLLGTIVMAESSKVSWLDLSLAKWNSDLSSWCRQIFLKGLFQNPFVEKDSEFNRVIC